MVLGAQLELAGLPTMAERPAAGHEGQAFIDPGHGISRGPGVVAAGTYGEGVDVGHHTGEGTLALGHAVSHPVAAPAGAGDERVPRSDGGQGVRDRQGDADVAGASLESGLEGEGYTVPRVDATDLG